MSASTLSAAIEWMDTRGYPVYLLVGDKVELQDGRVVKILNFELSPPRLDAPLHYGDILHIGKFVNKAKAGWDFRVGVEMTEAWARSYPKAKCMYFKLADIVPFNEVSFSPAHARPMASVTPDNPCEVCGWGPDEPLHQWEHRGKPGFGHAHIPQKPDMPGVQKTLGLNSDRRPYHRPKRSMSQGDRMLDEHKWNISSGGIRSNDYDAMVGEQKERKS